jgi:glutathione peroxidase
MKKLLLSLLVFLGVSQGNSIAQNFPEGTNAFSFSFESIDGGQLNLSQYKGKALLVVNTASLCGFTGQYEGLQNLWEKYEEKGLIVIGVPSNNFKAQEPGSDDEIKEVCETTFGINFPMTTKVNVKGDDVHPFYVWANSQSGEEPKWNFYKYLIAPDGTYKNIYSMMTKPTAGKLITAIEKILPAN